jgi:hypothetical protein
MKVSAGCFVDVIKLRYAGDIPYHYTCNKDIHSSVYVDRKKHSSAVFNHRNDFELIYMIPRETWNNYMKYDSSERAWLPKEKVTIKLIDMSLAVNVYNTVTGEIRSIK